MRFGHILLFLTSFVLAFGAVPAKKAPVRKGSAPRATGGKIAGTSRKTTGKNGRATSRKGSRTAAAAPAYSRQQVPTADRYREIQRALAEQGYLKSDVTGVWGADSVEALKQYQAQKSLPVTGKLSSLTLIGLGLGPRPGATTKSPSEKTPPLAEPSSAAQP